MSPATMITGEKLLRAVMLYDGIWDENNYYKNYKSKELIIDEDISYYSLIAVVKEELQTVGPLDTFKLKLWIAGPVNNVCVIADDVQVRSAVATIKNLSNALPFIVIEISDQSNCLELAAYTELSLVTTCNEDPGALITEFDASRIALPNLVEKGSLFTSKVTMKNMLQSFAISGQFEFITVRSSKSRYVLKCSKVGCNWFFRASTISGSQTWIVRKFIDEHDCSVDVIRRHHKQATCSMVSECIKDHFSKNTSDNMRPQDIIYHMKRKHGVSVSYQKARRAREIVIDDIRGSNDASYQMIPAFAYMLEQKNPGSITFIETDDESRFKFFFMAIVSSIEGWKHCRPIISVDGTFLKNKYQGTLLTACGIDANSHILPLAFGIVDSENDISWQWFFKCLKSAYGEVEDLVIVSDRHNSILKAVSLIYSNSCHVFCTFHISKNMKLAFKKKGLQQLFNSCCRCYRHHEFEFFMSQMETITPRIRKYLEDIGFDKWSIVFCPRRRFDLMTSNISESLNSTLKHARELSTIALLEFLLKLCQRWFYERKEKACAAVSDLTPKAEKRLEKSIKNGSKMMVTPVKQFVYNVYSGNEVFDVNLETRYCSCRKWSIDLFICPHASAVVSLRNLSTRPFIATYYTREEWIATYDVGISSLGNQEDWCLPAMIKSYVIFPPISRRGAGRPKKSRIPSQAEFKRKNKCGRCGILGHNKSSCRNAMQ